MLDFLTPKIPHKPYCTDELGFMCIRAQKTALKKRYIQLNPPLYSHFLIFDVDRAGAALAWEDANLPPPSWITVNPENKHAHLVYTLNTPVQSAEYAGSLKPIRFAAAVEFGLREQLQADFGYARVLTKNPLNPYWETYAAENIQSYDLTDLSNYFDAEDLNRYFREVARKKTEAEVIELYGLGRNCEIFHKVRLWAYRHICEFKTHYSLTQWRNEVLHQCNNVNIFTNPLMTNEVKGIAKSISNWVWFHFDVSESNKKFAELQSYRNSLRKNTQNVGRKNKSYILSLQEKS